MRVPMYPCMMVVSSYRLHLPLDVNNFIAAHWHFQFLFFGIHVTRTFPIVLKTSSGTVHSIPMLLNVVTLFCAINNVNSNLLSFSVCNVNSNFYHSRFEGKNLSLSTKVPKLFSFSTFMFSNLF